jgi:hypothetical protein
MASTAATVYSTSAKIGVDLDAKSSTASFKVLDAVTGTDGHLHVYARASEALGSASAIKIGTAGSASSDAGSGGFTCNTTGGVTAGQYFWARKTAF